MGNICLGPNLGGNGFLQSITSALWKNQTLDARLTQPKPDDDNNNKSAGNAGSPDSSKPSSDASRSKSKPIESTPPEPAKILSAELTKPPEPVTIPSVELPKPPEPVKVSGSEQTKPPEPEKPVQVNEPASKPADEKPEVVTVPASDTNNTNNTNNNNAKSNRPVHHRRVSSVGLQVDSVLGRKTENVKDVYSLGRKLGQGQFGTTYYCLAKATGKEFACKSISKRKLTTQDDVNDVRREIQIMHHLAGHPNVIQIVGAYEDAVAVHLVMELCSGGELFDRIVQRGYYSEKKAAELARIILRVVETCHSLGVMHRDLKPENFLFINPEEEAPLKTIDFGLSVFFRPGDTFTDVVGSPYYVAPEVLQKFYGQQCDIWSAGVIIYILLSGVPPFWDETEQGIFERVLKGELDFASEPWPKISESAKDLLRKMLVRDPQKRLTAPEVLSHPWVQVEGDAPDRPIDSAVLTRLKQFSAMNKLKKMAIRVIAESLSEEEIAGLKEMFKTIDTDNSGQITFEKLKVGLERVGAVLKDSELHWLMQSADVDNSGTIDYGEFIAAMLHLNKVQKEDHLYTAFSYFDKDSSGYITRDELEQACQQFGLEDVQLDDIIREVDKDNDGRIDYNEFVEMMQDTASFSKTGKLFNSISSNMRS